MQSLTCAFHLGTSPPLPALGALLVASLPGADRGATVTPAASVPCSRCLAALKGLRFFAKTVAHTRECFSSASSLNHRPQEVHCVRPSCQCSGGRWPWVTTEAADHD